MREAPVLVLDGSDTVSKHLVDNHISSHRRVIRVRGQVKGNKVVLYLKTDAAYRDADLCPVVAQLSRTTSAIATVWCFPLKPGRTPMSTGQPCSKNTGAPKI